MMSLIMMERKMMTLCLSVHRWAEKLGCWSACCTGARSCTSQVLPRLLSNKEELWKCSTTYLPIHATVSWVLCELVYALLSCNLKTYCLVYTYLHLLFSALCCFPFDFLANSINSQQHKHAGQVFTEGLSIFALKIFWQHPKNRHNSLEFHSKLHCLTHPAQ